MCLQLLGPDGVLAELTKRLLERAMDEGLTVHLGYERGDAGGHGSGNNWNGTSAKTGSDRGRRRRSRRLRDRNGTFDPKIVPKHARRLDGFNANMFTSTPGA